jgi:uncharacterized membrane protein required for colicin V production
MASLVILIIIVGCVAFQYLKGTFVRAFATTIITICASIIAFGYFEVLANVLVSRIDGIEHPALASWAQALCFIVLFVLAFAILQTALILLTRQPVDLGMIPELIGRVGCGIFMGLILSGILLTALAMAPLPNKYPYQRFDEMNPDSEMPNKVLLNVDGFAAGWFNMVSNGSFSAIANKKSFAALHPAFLDQVFLNRHSINDKITAITNSQAIEVPDKDAAWYAPEDIKDSEGSSLQKSGHNIVIVRIGIKRAAARQASTFTLSQLRLICRPKGDANQLIGKSKNVYPIGYLIEQSQIQKQKLSDQIKIGQFDSEEKAKWIDVGFYVPVDFVPVLVEFKLNSITEVKPPVPAEQAPPVIPFIMEEPEKEKATPERSKSSERPSNKPSGKPSVKRGLSDISKSVVPGVDEDK